MVAGALTQERRSLLHRRVKFIVGFTITWNVIEAIVALPRARPPLRRR